MYKKSFILLFGYFALACSHYAYGEVEGKSILDPKEIVRRYNQATSWDKKVAMNVNVETNLTSNEIGPGNAWRRRIDFIFRRDRNRTEWIGNKALLDKDGELIVKDSFDFVSIINDKLYLSAERHPELGQFLGHIKRNIEKEREADLRYPPYGGFLEGNISGAEELKTIPRRLMESDNLVFAGIEKINGTSCYVIEAKTKHGNFKVWLASDKGYNALKYIVSKTGRDLFGTKPIEETKIREWHLQVDSVKIQKLGDRYVPVEGQYTNTTVYKSGNQETINVKVKRSNIDLNPDFEAMKSFTFNLPDGTVILDADFPGTRYKIFGGELVPKAIEAVSLVNNPLPEFNGINIDINPERTANKMILVCFFDMQQRPSRNCIAQLAKEAEKLQSNDIIITAIQASKIDENQLSEFVQKYRIPFPIGFIQEDIDKTKSDWGVNSLPWLILTDKQHTVRAEGFAFSELDDKIQLAEK